MSIQTQINSTENKIDCIKMGIDIGSTTAKIVVVDGEKICQKSTILPLSCGQAIQEMNHAQESSGRKATANGSRYRR